MARDSRAQQAASIRFNGGLLYHALVAILGPHHDTTRAAHAAFRDGSKVAREALLDSMQNDLTLAQAAAVIIARFNFEATPHIHAGVYFDSGFPAGERVRRIMGETAAREYLAAKLSQSLDAWLSDGDGATRH
ncbi:hypothetical protein [Limibacillus sp. MBR-115]|jgi:hypothetical protein|uniref:hypothetical protein n=1 Tax=Limibacillus sp. MBR-115 TaxID=3156465 RepID=UPI003398CB1C